MHVYTHTHNAWCMVHVAPHTLTHIHTLMISHLCAAVLASSIPALCIHERTGVMPLASGSSFMVSAPRGRPSWMENMKTALETGYSSGIFFFFLQKDEEKEKGGKKSSGLVSNKKQLEGRRQKEISDQKKCQQGSLSSPKGSLMNARRALRIPPGCSSLSYFRFPIINLASSR